MTKTYYIKNRARILAQVKSYQQKNRDKIKAYKDGLYRSKGHDDWYPKWLLRKYGISEDQWNKIFDAQHRKCAICKTSEFRRKPSTDHCGKAGHVRGILCDSCNRALGLLHHDISTLAAAITYLSKEVIFNQNGNGEAHE